MLDCKIKDFSKRIQTKTGRPLKDLSVELTRRCNFACKHCYCTSPTSQAVIPPELSYDNWLDIFEQYAAEEGLFVTITGGEPLLRKDFKKFWVYLKKRGFLITLFTNGSLIDHEMADFFAQWTPLQISITLYGASDQTYENITGHKNMFGRVSETLAMLKERGIPLEVKGVFSRLNGGDFQSVKTIALKYCDLFRWDMALMGALPTTGNVPRQIRFTPEEYIQFEAAEPVRKRHMETLFKKWKAPEVARKKKGAFGCNVGSGGSVHINSHGIMHPCIPLESAGYNVMQGSLREGWYEAIPELVDTFPCQPGICQECAAAELCGPCVAFAVLEGCSVTGPVPFKCALVRARAEKYGTKEVLSFIPKAY